MHGRLVRVVGPWFYLDMLGPADAHSTRKFHESANPSGKIDGPGQPEGHARPGTMPSASCDTVRLCFRPRRAYAAALADDGICPIRRYHSMSRTKPSSGGGQLDDSMARHNGHVYTMVWCWQLGKTLLFPGRRTHDALQLIRKSCPPSAAGDGKACN